VIPTNHRSTDLAPAPVQRIRWHLTLCGLIDLRRAPPFHRAIQRVTKPMLCFKSFQAAQVVLAGIELRHMIRKGQLIFEGSKGLSFAENFYALPGQICPA
jgi:hypothetical protein